MKKTSRSEPVVAVAINTYGQATTEYILVLVVVVGIILGALWQFNKAFAAWAEAYFGPGGYIACLLDTGTLPNFGALNSGQCSLSQFSPSNGNSLANSTNGGAGNGGKSGSNSSTASSASSSAPGGNGNLTMLPGFGGGAFGTGATTFRANSAKNSKGKGSGGQNQFGGDSISNLQGYQGVTVIRIPLDEQGYYSYGWGGGENQKKTKIPVSSKQIKKGENASSASPLIKANRTVASVKKKSHVGGFNFGYLLRYFIIAIIIIAIVIFIGGQILQVSKSME